MKTYKKYRIEISPTKLRIFFFISKKNLLRIKLKNYWEQFLSTYQLSKKKILSRVSSLPFVAFEDFERRVAHRCLPLQHWNKKTQRYSRENVSHPGSHEGHKSFFYLKKEKFSQYNYLILAKLMDCLGDTQIVQSKIRDFIKIQTKYLELEKVFQFKIFKNSIFFSWISYLLIEQIEKFIKMTTSFLCKFQYSSLLGPLWRNKIQIEIQNTGNFLFLTYKDFFMLKWYQKKIHTWFYQVLIKTKETTYGPHNSKKIFNHSHISSVIEMGKKLIYSPKNEISNTFQIVKQKRNFTENGKINNWSPQESNKRLEKISVRLQKTKNSKQRYFKLLKEILLNNKIATQIELIQQLNQIVGNWDTFAINNITKKKARKLNLLLYQLLWYWGFARHRRQKAKWIKERYWFLRPF
jgi:hypothetical protein